MESQKGRRRFLKDCAKMGGTCCALLACHRLLPAEEGRQSPKPIDLAPLSYCGIPCVKVCPLYKATQENDVQMKKTLYERQEMKKKFGLDCANLDACDKEYWKKWPGQYASTKMIQARYRTQPGAVIKEGKAR
jgi:hypothetical protein